MEEEMFGFFSLQTKVEKNQYNKKVSAVAQEAMDPWIEYLLAVQENPLVE